MNVTYAKDTDLRSIIFSGAQIVESDEEKPGIILDYDDAGNLVSMEIMDASRRVNAPDPMDYRVNTAA